MGVETTARQRLLVSPSPAFPSPALACELSRVPGTSGLPHRPDRHFQDCPTESQPMQEAQLPNQPPWRPRQVGHGDVGQPRPRGRAPGSVQGTGLPRNWQGRTWRGHNLESPKQNLGGVPERQPQVDSPGSFWPRKHPPCRSHGPQELFQSGTARHPSTEGTVLKEGVRFPQRSLETVGSGAVRASRGGPAWAEARSQELQSVSAELRRGDRV